VQRPRDEFDCDNATLGIYWPAADQRTYVYENDDIQLLWEWRDVDEILLEDEFGSTYTLDQHTLWYVAASLDPQERWAAAWNTTFVLKWYTSQWREICKKSVSVDIIEVPTY
jgi:hypothetical protein